MHDQARSSIASAANERARRHDASGVVERAGGHEAQTVRGRVASDTGAVDRRSQTCSAGRAASSSVAVSTASSARFFVFGRVAGGEAGLDRASDPVPLAATAPVPDARQVRLVGGDAGLDRLPRPAGGDAEHVCEHDLVGEVGDRQHGAVAGPAERSASTPANAGANRCDLVLHVLDRLEPEVSAEAGRELLRDAPVVHRHALGRDEARPRRMHAALEVGGAALLLAPDRGGEEHVGAGGGVGGERADRDDERHARRGPARMRMRSGKSCSGSAPSTTSASMLPAAAASRIAGGVEARLRRHAPHAVGEVLAAGVERDPAGQEARA